jgi:glutathione S-transferase
MVLKLYGLYTTHTHLVITVLKETNTPYVLVELDFFGGAHKAPAYLEKQPFGEIPYIVCGPPSYRDLVISRLRCKMCDFNDGL